MYFKLNLKHNKTNLFKNIVLCNGEWYNLHIDKVAKGDIKIVKMRKVLRGGDTMEMRKETTIYKVADKKDVMNAIKRCTKKYEKALTNLAK